VVAGYCQAVRIGLTEWFKCTRNAGLSCAGASPGAIKQSVWNGVKQRGTAWAARQAKRAQQPDLRQTFTPLDSKRTTIGLHQVSRSLAQQRWPRPSSYRISCVGAPDYTQGIEAALGTWKLGLTTRRSTATGLDCYTYELEELFNNVGWSLLVDCGIIGVSDRVAKTRSVSAARVGAIDLQSQLASRDDSARSSPLYPIPDGGLCAVS